MHGNAISCGWRFERTPDPTYVATKEQKEAYARALLSLARVFEDMIADRLAPHAVSSPTDTSRVDQARAMFRVAEGIDHDSLAKRVLEEGGDIALLKKGVNFGLGEV